MARLNTEHTTEGRCNYCGELIWSEVKHCYRCPNWRHQEGTMELHEGQNSLDRRAEIGERCMGVAWHEDDSGRVEGDDRESAATDAISDILTALFGPAGTSSYGGGIHLYADVNEKARELLVAALESWKGDAEDYTRTPAPGEYGHEEND